MFKCQVLLETRWYFKKITIIEKNEGDIRCLRFFQWQYQYPWGLARWLNRWETCRKFYSCRQTAFLVNFRDTEFHDSITHSTDMEIVTGATSDLFESPVEKGYVTHTHTQQTRNVLAEVAETQMGVGVNATQSWTRTDTLATAVCVGKSARAHTFIFQVA